MHCTLNNYMTDCQPLKVEAPCTSDLYQNVCNIHLAVVACMTPSRADRLPCFEISMYGMVELNPDS